MIPFWIEIVELVTAGLVFAIFVPGFKKEPQKLRSALQFESSSKYLEMLNLKQRREANASSPAIRGF